MAKQVEQKIDTPPHQSEFKDVEGRQDELEDMSLLNGSDPRIKEIKRKTDIRICGLLGVLYAMAAIDRVNLGVSGAYLAVCLMCEMLTRMTRMREFSQQFWIE
jgi:hypothetical protein